MKWARQLESDLDAGVVPTNTKLLDETSVADLLIRYRDTVTIHKKGRSSEVTRLNSFLRQPWAKLNLSLVTAGTFSLYRDQRLSVVQPASVRRDLGLIRAVFEVAITEWDYPLVSNPLVNVKKPREPESRDRRLQAGERQLLLAASESHTVRWLKFGILLAIETGMRRGELLSVRWGDVSLSNSTLLLRDTKNGYSRTIPLSKTAVETFSGFRTPTCKDSDWVLNVTSNAFQLAWQVCKKKIAIKHPEIMNLRFHDLRHEAISRFFEMGLNVPEVALISGHRDPRMLFKYTHLRAEDIVHKINIRT
jgi:integrase